MIEGQYKKKGSKPFQQNRLFSTAIRTTVVLVQKHIFNHPYPTRHSSSYRALRPASEQRIALVQYDLWTPGACKEGRALLCLHGEMKLLFGSKNLDHPRVFLHYYMLWPRSIGFLADVGIVPSAGFLVAVVLCLLDTWYILLN